VAQTQELFELARQKNLVLLEAFHYRFHPASVFFRELLQKHIAEGHPLQHIKAVLTAPNTTFPSDDIRFNFKLGGGTMMDVGCYTVNSIRYFTGLEIDTVEEAKPKIISPEIDGRMEGVFQLKGAHSPGAKATFIASLTNSWFSLQTYREMIPVIVAETDQKIFTFGVFAMPGVSFLLLFGTTQSGGFFFYTHNWRSIPL
jgi:predicted dehydrogenase